MLKRTFSLLALALVATACAGITTNQDFVPGTNFSGFQTYGWMPVKDAGATDMVNQRIHSAVQSGLAAKGFQEATSGDPDFMVGHHLIMQDKTDYSTVNDYYGAGWGYGGMYPRRYGVAAVPMQSTSRTTEITYTMGTLVLDFFDAESKELVWRGTAEGKIHESNSPQERSDRAFTAVQKIMEQFPPNG